MKKIVAFIAVLLVVSVAMAASLLSKKQDNAAFQFGEFKISGDGILSIKGQSVHYLIVSRDKFPANLIGIAVINLDEKVYVARFFESGGIGVEGFFNVCFQLKNGKIFTNQIENAGSLERIKGSTYVKSCSYVFDSEKRVLLKIDSANTKPIEVVLVDQPKPYSGNTPWN